MSAHYSYEPECVKGKPDGYYLIGIAGSPQRCLVYLYMHPDFNGRRHLAYGMQDGGTFLPVADLREDVTLEPASITVGEQATTLSELDRQPAPDAGEEEER